MELNFIKENPDGSADYSITNLTQEETVSLIRLGIIRTLEKAIEEGNKLMPEGLDEDS